MEAKQITISNETATWLQMYSSANELAQNIFDTILAEQHEDGENCPNTNRIFEPMAEHINALAEMLFQRAATSIANNMADGGTTI